MPFQPGHTLSPGRRKAPVLFANIPAPEPQLPPDDPPREIVQRPPVAIPIADIDFGEIKPLTRFNKEMWSWTLFRMQKAWPGLSENKAHTQLYVVSNANEFRLLHHNTAVGLAYAGYHPLVGDRVVQQMFLFIRAEENRIKKTRISAGGQLYRAFERWARDLKAVRYEMEGHSDLDPAEIVECLKGSFHDVAFRDLTKLPQL